MGTLIKKIIFLNRFRLIWENDCDPSLSPALLDILLTAIKNAKKRYRHISEVVSVDLLDNMKIRYHANTDQAFHELCELVGLDPNSSINNITKYLLPSKPKYKNRFNLIWKDEFDLNNLPPDIKK